VNTGRSPIVLFSILYPLLNSFEAGAYERQRPVSEYLSKSNNKRVNLLARSGQPQTSECQSSKNKQDVKHHHKDGDHRNCLQVIYLRVISDFCAENQQCGKSKNHKHY
jgi:hypothetical protein